MASFSAREKSEWFKACHSNAYVGTVRDLLRRGFDPDERDDQGRSGLWHAALGTHSSDTLLIIEELVLALQKRYAGNSQALLKALTDGAGNKTPEQRIYPESFTLQDYAAAKRTLREAVLAVRIEMLDPELWFDACHDNDHGIIDTYLSRKFNPDTRDKKGRSGLWHMEGVAKDSWLQALALKLTAGLETYYDGDPAGLLKALTDGDGKLTPEQKFRNKSHDSIKRTLHDRTEELKQLVPQPVSLTGTEPLSPKKKSVPPLKLDNTVTAAKLQQKRGGQTKLQILGEQGRLGELFTATIWNGRNAEMDNVWQQVPEQHRDQVDIEEIRDQLAQAGVRERFAGRKSDWKKGF